MSFMKRTGEDGGPLPAGGGIGGGHRWNVGRTAWVVEFSYQAAEDTCPPPIGVAMIPPQPPVTRCSRNQGWRAGCCLGQAEG